MTVKLVKLALNSMNLLSAQPDYQQPYLRRSLGSQLARCYEVHRRCSSNSTECSDPVIIKQLCHLISVTVHVLSRILVENSLPTAAEVMYLHTKLRTVTLHYTFVFNNVYTRCLKNVQNCFCQNFVKFPPMLIIFGKKQ